ncbi:MAG: GNAT family N-acetyltransferase, partial [Sediminibacterium sp.]
VWNALVSGNNQLANGSERVKFFDEQVSPFAALVEDTPANLLELHAIHPSDKPILLWADRLLSVPEKWKEVDCIPGFQMVYDAPVVPDFTKTGITALTVNDITGMLALTKLTKPGPFGTRTIEFGNYEGIFANGQLVAMTGQRFHCFNHIEISAVCTHPAYLGRGYAKQLLLSQLTKIVNSSVVPYLHVRQDNERAIHVYKTLGFVVRMPVYFYVIKKQS